MLASLAGCGLTTHVRPVEKGAVAVEAAVGGPLYLRGKATDPTRLPVPLPLATVGMAIGVVDRLDVHAHLHITTLLAQGRAGADLGATWLALRQSRPAVPALSLTGRGYHFTDFERPSEQRAELTAAASWAFARRFLAYGALSFMAVLPRGELHLSPAAGVQARWGRLHAQLEARFFDRGLNPLPDPFEPEWVSGGTTGAFGAVLGLGWQFGTPPAGG